ncbi:MAG: glycoside hydrolase family 3 C-terminal domain-containing protein [Lachnospiraceae bacterium]|nr:glycoside hydrolase family 3 C-terminal domain-containing protein [Lachnospiraceae bacterium]
MSDYKSTPLWNNELPIEERLDYLINELTLEEKITCLTTGCPDIERLGIKASYMGGEAAHGIEARHDQAFNAGEPEPTTSFTQPIGMSGSFDRELIKECGRAVGEEARALFTRNGGGGLCRWAPTIDMERDPRWGRTEEAYGEDPYLTGEMSAAYIQGMKGDHPFYLRCGATLKHFYANNVEQDRIKISSSLDGRNKYEYYLEPFRKAIEEGGAEAIMTSYNEINGVPAIVNPEVQEILKDTYGLPGHVVCDGGDFQQTVYDHQYFETHAETVAYGLKAGVDCFTDNGEVVFAAAREALAKGLMTEEDVNRSVRNSFRTRIRLGFFDNKGECPYTGMGEEFINNEEHKTLSAKMAQESVVLLKNEAQILPIKPEETSSLAVIGPMADVWYKDWYCGIPPYEITPLAGIKEQYKDTAISYESGLYDIYLTCEDKYIGLDENLRLRLTDKEHAEVFCFTDWGCGSTTLQASSNNKFVTLEEGSYLIKADKKEAFSWFIRESFRFINTQTGSFDVEPESGDAYYINSWNGRKVTVDEDGYLVVIKTDEKTVGEGDDEKLGRKCHAVFRGEPSVFGMEIVTNGIADAVNAAKEAEKAVVIIGSNPVINSKEEIDRTTLELPPAQQRLVDAVLAVNPQTVVILVTNYPYSVNRLQETVPGILYAPSGSQELGTGIASVISGEVSPAARLAMTWYRSEKDLPDINDYDIIQGKRTYQYFEKEVLYPFGYGLTYSEFLYGPLTLEKDSDNIKVTFKVTNKGEATSDEVVQLYVRKEKSRVKQPLLQLKGFDRIKGMEPGETREVSLMIKTKDLRYFDVISDSLLLEEGDYTFMLGASSKDIRQSQTIFVEGSKAPARNPFAETKAEQYDAYENCFIHKGCKGHTTTKETAIIPGKAGDAPDVVDNDTKEKVSGVLRYKDFVFDKQPQKVRLLLSALQDGTVTFMLNNADGDKELCEIHVSSKEDRDFEWIEADIIASDIKENSNTQLTVNINGKIKLAKFLFL